MRKRGWKAIAACTALALMLSGVGAGAGYPGSGTVYAEESESDQTGNVLSLGDAQSEEVQFGPAEDWDNTLMVTFPGDSQAIAAKSELDFTMTISSDAYTSMGEDDYIKLEADFFQAENNWDTLGKLGWPMFKASDFQENADSTYSTEVKMVFESNLGVFHSLWLRGVGTGFKGKVTFSGVSLTRAEIKEEDVEITETIKDTVDIADLTHMAGAVKLVDAEATDSTKVLAAYLLGLKESGQVVFGHQNASFKSVCDNGVTSDAKDITGADPGLFGIDTLALAGCETGKKTRQEALDASIDASLKAYEGGSLISLSCHMPNFTNEKITATGDTQYPYDFTACDFTESKDLTPCADYILEGGEYNPQFRAYLDIIADYAKALQEKGIPVLFRPFHENSGGWFWWGTSTSVESYHAIWRYMVHYLADQGVHNFLYVYSPNGPFADKDVYLERYPGDAYVDILAFDFYDDYADAGVYTGDIFFENLAKSCKVVQELAAEKGKIPAIAETGIRITGAGKDSLMVSGNPTTGHDWYNKVVNTAAENQIPYFLLWANFDKANFFVPYKTSETTGHEMINEFISFYNNEKSVFGNGTNFYTAGGALEKADSVTLSGYSTEISGYMITPKNYAVIKEPCDLKGYVKNASEDQVKFIVKASENAQEIPLPAKKDGNIYTGTVTPEVLGQLGKTSTGVIILSAAGQELGRASFVNFGKDIDILAKGMFENFEYYYGNDALLQSKYGAHNSAANCSSSLSLNRQEKAEGDYSGAFHYVLSYKGSEVWTGGLGRAFDKDKTDLSEYNAVSMWVKPDGNGQKMVIQMNDNYEAYLTEFVKGTKAQYVTIPFTSFKKKGNAEESVDSSNITSFKLWCNSVPENYKGTKDENGNYTVDGTILFDDMKAVKISSSDLAKVNEQGLIVSDAPLTGSEDRPGEEIPPKPEQVKAPAKISLTSVKKESKTSRKAVLRWKKASDATGYEIYMKAGKKGTYKLLGTVGENGTLTFKTGKLKKDVTYYFKVRGYKTALGQTAYGEYSGEKKITIVTAPKNASLTSVKVKSGKAVLKWKKAARATGYKIYMKTGSKGKYKLVKTIKKKSTTSYTTKKLKKNIKYYFKIRSYKTISGDTAYGRYSKVKSVKTR